MNCVGLAKKKLTEPQVKVLLEKDEVNLRMVSWLEMVTLYKSCGDCLFSGYPGVGAKCMDFRVWFGEITEVETGSGRWRKRKGVALVRLADGTVSKAEVPLV